MHAITVQLKYVQICKKKKKHNHCLNFKTNHMCNNAITGPDDCCPVFYHVSSEIAFNILNVHSQIWHCNHGFIWIMSTREIMRALKLFIKLNFRSQKWHWIMDLNNVCNHVYFEVALNIELSLTNLTLVLRIQMTLAHVHNYMSLKVSFKVDTGIRNSNKSCLHV